MTPITRLLAATCIAGLATPVFAQEVTEGKLEVFATAQISGADQGISGEVTLNKTASGVVLVQIDLAGLPEGEHAVHLHETGDCSATDFSSAGGHLAGDREHGILAKGGPHPGDMPNITVGADGVMKADVFLSFLDLDSMVMDTDGTSIIVHEGADDYGSQPAGDAGPRIACGVFESAAG